MKTTMETTTKHTAWSATPGPWKAARDPANGRLKVLTDDHTSSICTLNPVMTASLGNAKLLAAAPELLAVCQMALERNGVDGDEQLREAIKAAIAKATL